MKTNTLKLILATVAASGLALLVVNRIAASNLTLISISVSYTAVAILLALAALDYRLGPKSYRVQ
ncbi:MAG TPA: hypothetical protein VKC51_03495 [Lacunisphaera sp.]|nr:hypothetical protein [Lacunisphaera sp.]